MSEQRERQRDEVFSKSVKAGRRTYFFDVKSTKAQDFYLTITESKKRIGDDGNPFYEKHKVFLYREDFEKFMDVMNEVVGKVGELCIENPPPPREKREPRENYTPPSAEASDKKDDNKDNGGHGPSFTDINFEDLGS